VFLKVGADPEVQKLRRKVAHGNKMKHVPALYLATAMALQGMTKRELEALKLRIEEKRVSAPQQLYADASLSRLVACRVEEPSCLFGEMRWQELSFGCAYSKYRV
jgi:hypothetical protein